MRDKGRSFPPAHRHLPHAQAMWPQARSRQSLRGRFVEAHAYGRPCDSAPNSLRAPMSHRRAYTLEGRAIVTAKAIAACAAAFAAVVLGHPGNLHAAAETWELRDVTFSDGGTANGWFRLDFDAAPRKSLLLDWDVTTSGGDAEKFETWRYLPSSSGGAAGRSSLSLHSSKSFGAGRNNFRVLYLTFSVKPADPHVKGARHNIELISNTGNKPASYEDINATGTFRLLTAGRIAVVARPSETAPVVPEPATADHVR